MGKGTGSVSGDVSEATKYRGRLAEGADVLMECLEASEEFQKRVFRVVVYAHLLLVGKHIMATSDDPRMHRWLNMQFLMTYHHNFVRHVIEGELQRRIYALAEKGQPVTASLLSKVQGEILDEFWGGEVEIAEGARLTRMRQPLYHMGLYPYSYSASLTIGTAVTASIEQEGQPVVDRWLEVLKAGGTLPPVDLAAMAGVDMTNPEAIRTAVEYVGKLVDGVEQGFAG